MENGHPMNAEGPLAAICYNQLATATFSNAISGIMHLCILQAAFFVPLRAEKCLHIQSFDFRQEKETGRQTDSC